MKAKVKTIILILLLAVVAAAAVYRYGLQEERGKLYTGTLEVTTADVTAKTSGYIRELYLDEGMKVNAGEPAALISRDDLTAALERDQAAIRAARSSRDAAQAQAVLAQKDLARYQMLMTEDAISRQQMDQSQASWDAAAAQLQAAEETVRQMEKAAAVSESNLADTTVYMPLSGLVLTKNFEPGEFASAGAAIATVADLSDCWVRVYVPTEEMGRLRVGDPAEIYTDGQEGKAFPGYIKEIRDQAEFTPRQSISPRERANMVFAVKVQLENGDGLFKPGMIADVRFRH